RGIRRRGAGGSSAGDREQRLPPCHRLFTIQVKISSHEHMDQPTQSARAEGSRYLPIILLLFAASGCSALIYEATWYQLLQLSIGSTSVSLGFLLATFMGGLCIGSVWFPRLKLGGQHPLRIYALVEAAIGVCAILIHFLVPLVNYVYIAGAEHGLPGMLLR